MMTRTQTAKIFAVAALIALVATLPVQADTIHWGTAGQHLYAANGHTPLPGHRDRSETTTGFVQLLWLGPNGAYDGLSGADDGTMGDDQVIAKSWVGDGNPVFLADTPGQFDATDTPLSAPYSSGADSFAIRVFDTAVSDADWAAGNIPVDAGCNTVVFANPVKVADFYNLWMDDRLMVPMGDQTIDFPPPSVKTYGDAPFALSAIPSSGLPPSFASNNEAVVTVTPSRGGGWTANIVGAGEAVITASQNGDSNWNPAPPVARTLSVQRATLTVIAEDKAKILGSTNPTLTIRYEGLQYADSAPATPPTASCTADADSPAGEYDIVTTGGNDPNYTLNLQNGTLAVVEGLALRLWAATDEGGPFALEFGETETAVAGNDPLDETARPGQIAHLSCPFPSATEPRVLTRDFRPVPGDQLTRWRLEVLPGQDRSGVTLAWNVAAAAAEREIWLQQLSNERPVGFPVDMKVQNELPAVAPGTVFEIIYGILQQDTVALRKGWNAIGTPLLSAVSLGDLATADRGAGVSHFPVWHWIGGGFEPVEADGPFLPETGYLVHCDADSATLTVTGLPPDGVMPQAPGWHLLRPPDPLAPAPIRVDAPAIWQWDAEGQCYRLSDAFIPGQACWWFTSDEK